MLFSLNMAVHVEAVQGPTDKSEVLGKRRQGKSSGLWFLFSVSSSLSPSPSWGLSGHAQLPQQRDTLFWPFSFVCAPLCLFPAICPLSAPLAHISTHNTPQTFSLPPSRSWFLSFARPHPLCVTGLPFLIADPSLCYYSAPPLYDMFLFYGAYKGSIWSEGYGARVAEMQLHGGNLCLGRQWWVDLISSKVKDPSYSKAQSHLLSTFNRDRPVTDIASQLSEAKASFSGSSTAGPKT